MLSRVINGVPRAIFYQGEQIGENRCFNDRLAMFLLRYRDPLRYGSWLDRREFSGRPEAAAIDLAAAKRSVREDAGLGAHEVADRVERRHSAIAGKMHMEHATLEEEPPGEAHPEGDVP